jgi:hypothetical protein
VRNTQGGTGRWGWTNRARPTSASGSVTAEFAIAMPALMVIISMLVAVSHILLAKSACMDAAYRGARMAARGEETSRIRSASLDVAPEHAVVLISSRDTRVVVVVKTWVYVGLPHLPAIHVQARAVADLEGMDHDVSSRRIDGGSLTWATLHTLCGPSTSLYFFHYERRKEGYSWPKRW